MSKEEDYALGELAKEYRRKVRAKHRGSRACWSISLCWQVLGIFGMMAHVNDANIYEVIGVLWVIIALLVRREE